jgi:hypothetical protein
MTSYDDTPIPVLQVSSSALRRLGRSSPSSSPSTERFPVNTTAARNPLSLRLYKSLSLNFEDDISKEALKTLSALYSTSLAGRPALRPKQSAENSDSDEDDAITRGRASSSLSASVFARSFIENPPLGDLTIAERARKNSRRDVERQLISSSVKFLHAFGDVNEVRTAARIVICTSHEHFLVVIPGLIPILAEIRYATRAYGRHENTM